MNIDKIITEYDITTDTILNKYWTPMVNQMWTRIESYGSGINEYGKDTLSPHLTRISADSRDFLLYLGYEEQVANNFYDAIKISDIGKTHEEFAPNIWKLPNKPTQEQRIEKRLHTSRGLEVLVDLLKDAPKELLEHPHIKTVVPVHINDHHTALSQNPSMGRMMEIACLVDAYDGDMDAKKITHGGGSTRTADEQYERMTAKSTDDKYHGYFRDELVDSYFAFRKKHI